MTGAECVSCWELDFHWVGGVLNVGVIWCIMCGPQRHETHERKGPKAVAVRFNMAPQSTSTRTMSREQAGDLQGLSEIEDGDFESIAELAAEGQAFEAEVLEGIENAPDPDVAEVRTREVPEDDVPLEYLEDR